MVNWMFRIVENVEGVEPYRNSMKAVGLDMVIEVWKILTREHSEKKAANPKGLALYFLIT